MSNRNTSLVKTIPYYKTEGEKRPILNLVQKNRGDIPSHITYFPLPTTNAFAEKETDKKMSLLFQTFSFCQQAVQKNSISKFTAFSEKIVYIYHILTLFQILESSSDSKGGRGIHVAVLNQVIKISISSKHIVSLLISQSPS